MQFIAKTNRTTDLPGQLVLALIITVPMLVFATHSYAQTITATGNNPVSSSHGEIIAQSTILKQKEAQMTQATKKQPLVLKEDTSIRSFQINIPKQALVDLRHRVAATKWPSQELVTDATQGMYQLIRQPGSIMDREFVIEFLDPGAEAFDFTFG